METTLHGDGIFDKFGCQEAPPAVLTVKHWLENQNFPNDRGTASEMYSYPESMV